VISRSLRGGEFPTKQSSSLKEIASLRSQRHFIDDYNPPV
jgi:hypothetical protein